MTSKRAIVLIALIIVKCASPQDMLDQARAANRSKLLSLQVGMTRDTVLQTMGTAPMKIRDLTTVVQTITNPFRTEMYQTAQHRFEILFYYTDLKRSDGAITDDELTPLVLKDGALDGWGWSYLKDVSARYEIRIR